MDFISDTMFTVIASALGLFLGIVILIFVRNKSQISDDKVSKPPKKKGVGECGCVTAVFVCIGLGIGLYTKRVGHWLSTGFWVGFAVAAAIKSLHSMAEARDPQSATSQESVRRYGKKHRIV